VRRAVLAAVAVALVPAQADAATRLVGPGHPYAKPCDAMAAAKPGDRIRIDAKGNGTYDGDVCSSSTPRLTIEGYRGRAKIDAAGKNEGGKGIWILSGPNTTVRNVELSGAKVPDKNGAAIRLEGDGDLRLDRVVFHHNEDGILVTASATKTSVTIDRSTFAANGAGDGYSHNIYVARARSFTMRRSTSRSAKVGHLVKSRAARNTIDRNRLTSRSGTASYELDLPDGGVARVTNNVLEQGTRSENPALLAFGEESVQPGSKLTVVGNTFRNLKQGNATALLVGSAMTGPITQRRNRMTGISTRLARA
jgi:hypothetical protein